MNFSELFSEQQIAEVALPLVTEYVPKLAGLVIALVAAKILSSWSEKAVHKALKKTDAALQNFLANLAKYSVLTVGVVTALSYVGIETASFAAVIAASGLAIGLAFQGTLSNFSAGVMLLIFRPFKSGDFVDAGGEMGFIVAIELFSTEIRTVDNKKVIVPNSKIFGATITNYSAHDTRRVDVNVGTEYKANVDETRKILDTIPGQIQGALKDPAPQIFLAGLGSSSIDWQLRVWCKTEDYWDVYQRLTSTTKNVLDAANIGIPFPQQDVHFDEQFIKAVKSA